jgi:hypothetical protein
VSICLVLGAGSSLCNAQHFRQERGLDTHPPLDTTFFEKLRVLDVSIPPALRLYMRELLGADPTPRLLSQMRMEEFFKDLYYDFQSNPESAQTRSAYIQLVNVYTRVLRETTNWLCEDSRRGAPVGQLIAAAADAADSVSVLTFNHDLIIENEIFKRARLRPRWCIQNGYGTIGQAMTTIRSGIAGGDFPRHSQECNHSRPINVLKLHGSLNWVVRMRGSRPSANQLTGRRAPSEVILSRRREIITRLRYTVARKGRGRSSWYTWPVIIPPIYAKQALIETVQPVWDQAREALRVCDQALIFGYSLPIADIEAEKLFQRALSANHALRRVVIVNPDPDSTARYARLLPKKPFSWYPTVQALLDDQPFAS